jgi:hypothetical protein
MEMSGQFYAPAALPQGKGHHYSLMNDRGILIASDIGTPVSNLKSFF